MDFSSDHTLVSDSRFPYLINMYKDYASGGGQGIETVPGFRRRFVAPNGGRIHGIHSYRDRSGQRHALVHAGNSLYKWQSYPTDAGFAKEIVAVVKEYDEFSSSVEGVGIATDYVQIEFEAYRPFTSNLFDVRSIGFIDSQMRISIYPADVEGRAVDNFVYVPDAYTFQHKVSEADGYERITVKIRKQIKGSDGTVYRALAAGDTINVRYCSLYKEDDKTSWTSQDLVPSLTYMGLSDTGARIIKLTYRRSSSYGSHNYLPIRYGWWPSWYTEISNDCIPPGFENIPELVSGAKKIPAIRMSDGSNLDVFSINKYGCIPSVTVLYDGDEELESIPFNGESFYQLDAEGEKIYLPAEAGAELDYQYVRYYDNETACTATEFDEYADEGKTDYNCIDLSDGSGLDVTHVYLESGAEIASDMYRREGDLLLVAKRDLEIGKRVIVMFGSTSILWLYEHMNERDSTSFVFGDKLYILDGKNYLVYDGEQIARVMDSAYIPTTYINIVVGGENADAGKELEARNMLSPYFKHTFIPDGETTQYHLNENKLDGILEVKVYGEVVAESEYTVDLLNGKVTFKKAPARSETVEGYPEYYAGVEITAEKGVYPAIEGEGETTGAEFRSMIEEATIATVFDNRVFFSGVPSKPNFIFWSSLKNPSYIGILNYQQDGVGTSPITAMITVANTLLVLKGDTEDGGAVFYHTPVESGIDVMAKSYPSEEGLAGIGCLGAACNFLDDPVFISRLGLEGVGKLNLSYERSKEHRSSLIDAKLVNLKDLASAKLCEWSGYLVLLVDGKIFLADSRQQYADQTGVMQYEWYYLEDVGVFEGQYKRYEYLREFPRVLMDGDNRRAVTVPYEGRDYTAELLSDVILDVELTEVGEGVDKVVTETTVNGITFEIVAAMYELNGSYHACLCSTDDEMIGGTFRPATVIKTIDENLYFGTENGVLCSFNFDMRGSDGAIPATYYTFDGRTIYSGCAFKMDNCGIPHMTKTTVKKSTVVKVKSFMRTAAKVRVRTNKNPFNEIARINGTRFSFEDMDFSDFSFVSDEDTLFAVREKEKKWVEKQYYVYSDEYKKPFALYYLAYKYFVAGKYKG